MEVTGASNAHDESDRPKGRARLRLRTPLGSTADGHVARVPSTAPSASVAVPPFDVDGVIGLDTSDDGSSRSPMPSVARQGPESDEEAGAAPSAAKRARRRRAATGGTGSRGTTPRAAGKRAKATKRSARGSGGRPSKARVGDKDADDAVNSPPAKPLTSYFSALMTPPPSAPAARSQSAPPETNHAAGNWHGGGGAGAGAGGGDSTARWAADATKYADAAGGVPSDSDSDAPLVFSGEPAGGDEWQAVRLPPYRLKREEGQSAYTTHFQAVVRSVRERSDLLELLSGREREALAVMGESLSVSAQGLYARLMTRRGPWFSCASLVRYEEVGRSKRGVQAAVRELIAFKLLLPLPGGPHAIPARATSGAAAADADELEHWLALEAAHACLNAVEVKRVVTALGIGPPPAVRSGVEQVPAAARPTSDPERYGITPREDGAEAASSRRVDRWAQATKESMLDWLRDCCFRQRTLSGKRLPLGRTMWKVLSDGRPDVRGRRFSALRRRRGDAASRDGATRSGGLTWTRAEVSGGRSGSSSVAVEVEDGDGEDGDDAGDAAIDDPEADAGAVVAEEDVPVYRRPIDESYDPNVDGPEHYVVRLAADYQALFRRVHSLYYLATDTAMLSSGYGWGSVTGASHVVDGALNAYGGFVVHAGKPGAPPLFSPGLMCMFGKLAYAPYACRFVGPLMPSRRHLIAYEAALKLQADVEGGLMMAEEELKATRAFVLADGAEDVAGGGEGGESVASTSTPRPGGTAAESAGLASPRVTGVPGGGAVALLRTCCRGEPLDDEATFEALLGESAQLDVEGPVSSVAVAPATAAVTPDALSPTAAASPLARRTDEVAPVCEALAERVGEALDEYARFASTWRKEHGPAPSSAAVCLRSIDAGWVLATTLWHAVQTLEKVQRYEEALKYLRQLLRSRYTPHRRGRWWERLCVNLAHLGRPVQACIAAKEGAKDEYVVGGDRLGLERRLAKLQQRHGVAASVAVARFRGRGSPSLSGRLVVEGETSSDAGSKSGWHCAACTLLNDAAALQCAVCRKIRPDDTPSSVSTPRSAASRSYKRSTTVHGAAGKSLGDPSAASGVVPVTPFTETLQLYRPVGAPVRTLGEVVLQAVPLNSATGFKSRFVGFDGPGGVNATSDASAVAPCGGVTLPAVDGGALDAGVAGFEGPAAERGDVRVSEPAGSGPSRLVGGGDGSSSVAGADITEEQEMGDSVRVSVEELCLQHYRRNGGWLGLHCEGGPIYALFGLLMWDALFADVSNAFWTPFQDAPLDLFADGGVFFRRRERRVCGILHKLCLASRQDVVKLVGDAWRAHYGQCCTGVAWDRYSLHTLQLIAACIGGTALAGILDVMAFLHKHFRGGMPDLLVYRSRPRAAADGSGGTHAMREQQPAPAAGVTASLPTADENGADDEHGDPAMRDIVLDEDNFVFEAKFVEVKGPRDRLFDKQRAWLRVLLRAGVDTELCRVLEDTSTPSRRRRAPGSVAAGAASGAT